MIQSSARAIARTAPARRAFHAARRAQLNVHEYVGIQLLAERGVNVPRAEVAQSKEDAAAAFAKLGGDDAVIKAQTLAGGRGKGKFKSGLQGGVHFVRSEEEAASFAEKMVGNILVTKQTGKEGKLVSKALLMERLYLRREAYFSILMDRGSAGPCMVGSPEGGTSVSLFLSLSLSNSILTHTD